ncbi:MAG: hypothetical protein KDC57_23520 [Saprospiraceae bacterium]|nr:hypothetical protein [Saprospiraceae bacterium]
MEEPGHNQYHWFKPVAWIFIPVSTAGYLITLLTLLFCINVFLVIDRHSHSVSDTFYGCFPYFISTLVVFFWIASHTSDHQKS